MNQINLTDKQEVKEKPKTIKIFDSVIKETDLWKTPVALKKAISEHIIPFAYLHDPCPKKPTIDGLDHCELWDDWNYINPPFSTGHQLQWAKECVFRIGYDSVMNLLLIRFDPTAAHFKYMMGKCHIVWMPDKRIKFIGADNSYNFPLALYQIQRNPPKWPAFQTLRIP